MIKIEQDKTSQHPNFKEVKLPKLPVTPLAQLKLERAIVRKKRLPHKKY